jgi:hypothetical protein
VAIHDERHAFGKGVEARRRLGPPQPGHPFPKQGPAELNLSTGPRQAELSRRDARSSLDVAQAVRAAPQADEDRRWELVTQLDTHDGRAALDLADRLRHDPEPSHAS